MELKNVKYFYEDNIAIIRFHRSKALNALNNDTLKELDNIVDIISKDNQIQAIIIIGEGKAFVAGADIVEMQPYGATEVRMYAKFAQSIFDKIEMMGKPVIAAINGYALGGGCELALSCDIRIASTEAIFGQPEVRLGVIPCFGGTQRLARLIGIGRAKDLIFTGRKVNAQEAYQLGIVNKVVAPEQLLEEAIIYVKQILENAPLAIGYAKTAINRGLDMDLANGLLLEREMVALSFFTEDKKEGINAFIEKRRPIFQNK